jgi:hypothetical protein
LLHTSWDLTILPQFSERLRRPVGAVPGAASASPNAPARPRSLGPGAAAILGSRAAGRHRSGPAASRARSSADRASASGAGPSERGGIPRQSRSETERVLRSIEEHRRQSKGALGRARTESGGLCPRRDGSQSNWLSGRTKEVVFRRPPRASSRSHWPGATTMYSARQSRQ